MATEIASAYVSLVPSFRGGGRAISNSLAGPISKAGVARNEICRQVKDAYSRQKALDLLNASVLLDRADEAEPVACFRIETSIGRRRAPLG